MRHWHGWQRWSGNTLLAAGAVIYSLGYWAVEWLLEEVL